MNPLVKFLSDSHRDQAYVLRRFAELKWPCTAAIVSMWCSDKRRPGFVNQQRLEAVTGGKCTPAHWLKYRQRTCRHSATANQSRRRTA